MNAPEAAKGALDLAIYSSGASALLPETILTLGVLVLLLWEAFAPPEGLKQKAGYAAAGILALTGLAALMLSGQHASLFSGMVVVDPFTDFFRIFAVVAGLFGVLVAMRSDEIGKSTGEYFSMFLALVLGMILMAEASDILMIYIAIEIVSFMSYVLAGFRRHDRKGAEAALKYVIYGGAASGVMLFGFSLLYGLTGHTQLSQINQVVTTMSLDAAKAALHGDAAIIPVALTAGLVLSFAGFAYKISAVPLHMWSPDVYEGAPTPFTAFLSTGPKAAGFAALIRFFVVGFADAAQYEGKDLLAEVTSLPWPTLIVVVSLMTMTLGNLAAIGQSNIKRFLAYSSIAHAGYALIGVSAFSKAGASSVMFYLSFYILMNIGAFFAVIWVREKTGSERIDDYEGLGYRAPFVAVALAVCLFSLTGLPPLAGFIGKFFLFYAAIDRGNAYPIVQACLPAARAGLSMFGKLQCSMGGGSMYYLLALVGLLNSAVSLYYYARVIGKMFLRQPVKDAGPIAVDFGTKLVLGPIAALLLVLGITWQPLWNAAQHAIDFYRPTLADIQPGPMPSAAQAEGGSTAKPSVAAQ